MTRNNISWSSIHPKALSFLISRAVRSLVYSLTTILAVPEAAHLFDERIQSAQIPNWVRLLVPTSSVLLSVLGSFTAAHFNDPESTTFSQVAATSPSPLVGTVTVTTAPAAAQQLPVPTPVFTTTPTPEPALSELPPPEQPIDDTGWSLDNLEPVGPPYL